VPPTSIPIIMAYSWSLINFSPKLALYTIAELVRKIRACQLDSLLKFI